VRVFVRRLACILRCARHDRRTQPGIGREHAVEANQIMNSSGDMTICVVPSR
jgi:hypothetical protein